MRHTLFALLLSVFLMSPSARPRAGLDMAVVPSATTEMQLIVVEARGCIYCGLFRRDLLPAYQSSEQAKAMPVRFVDVNDIERDHLNLLTPVAVVPTFVVVKANNEIGRISGYVGPEDFFHSIKYLLSSAP